MDTRNSLFYGNKRVVAESIVLTSHLVFPNTCKNNVKHNLDFYLIILGIILSSQVNKTFTKSFEVK